MNRRLLFALAASGALALLLPAGAATSAAQPATVSATEVQRLEDAVTELETELSALHIRDPSRARSFDDELQQMRDDVAYLKVGLRKDAGAPRHEYTTLQARIESLRQRIRGTSRAQPGAVGPAPADPPPMVPPPAPAAVDQAREVLLQVRQALGGDARMAAIETMGASGTFRRVIGGNTVAGALELLIAIPDRFQRTEQPTLPSGAPGTRFVTTFSGSEGWMRLIGQSPPGTPPGPPSGPGPGGPAGGPGRGGPPPDPTGRIRNEFHRLMLALLPGTRATSGLTLAYAGSTSAADGHVQIIDALAQSTRVAQLFIDADHRPLRLSYLVRDPSQGGPGLQRRPDETPEQARQRLEDERRTRSAEGQPQPPARMAIVWTFSYYRHVDGVMLPHRIAATAADKPIWAWEISTYHINRPIDPQLFLKRDPR